MLKIFFSKKQCCLFWICMWVDMCVSVLRMSVWLCLCVYLFVYMSKWMCMCLCAWVYMCVCGCVAVYMCLCVCISVCMSVRACVCVQKILMWLRIKVLGSNGLNSVLGSVNHRCWSKSMLSSTFVSFSSPKKNTNNKGIYYLESSMIK